MKVITTNDTQADLIEGCEYTLYHTATLRKRTPKFHSHEFYEIYFYQSGDASVYIEEHAYRLKPRDVIIFPPGRMHRAVIHDPLAYYERMLIYISRESLSSMAQYGFNPLSILGERIAHSQLHRALTEEQFDQCANLINDVIACADDDSPRQRVLSKCKVTMLITLICDFFCQSTEERTPVSSNRMASVIAYINAHIAEPLSLDEIAGKFFISKYHLSREFKNYTNRTVYQYILSKRIILAKQYLQAGQSPTDASALCGFRDYSSFYKAFTKESGASPQRYAALAKHPAHIAHEMMEMAPCPEGE